MADAFSTQSAEIIHRPIEIDAIESPEDLNSTLEEVYEINETVAELEKHSFGRVALQFPDELLPYSVPIYRSLKAKLPAIEFYVMADTTYGSCCVDEVAAQHVDADAVVHYGHACLSPTTRLPSFYVFPRKAIDAVACAEALRDAHRNLEQQPTSLVIILDLAYHYKADLLRTSLEKELSPELKIHMWTLPDRFIPPQSTSSSQGAAVANRHRLPSVLLPNECVIYYIGGESLALNNILLTNGQTTVFSYDPASRSTRLESPKSNRLLMRRYAVVHKARDADVFGILVGTLGVGKLIFSAAQYLPVINFLRKAIARARKKSYTVSVGKLNPAKLGNFMEIECFVLVACPENSIIDGKDFLRPIITPHELLATLDPEFEWGLEYTLSFTDVLAQASQTDTVDPPPNDDDDDQPTFSLVSGTYRHAKNYGPGRDMSLDGSSTTVATRSSDRSLTLARESAAGIFLQARTFRGLEQNIGQDAPSILEQGRSGVAQGYGEAS
ncbi:diphthamide biosynthesis protein [Clavulina sp. PMI_390]|nr:diphthamide biosynthesis protein [Clavulina sp. PMI_390]